MPRGALIVATAAVAISACSAGSAPLTKLTDQRAKCMDGTLSGYYYQQSSTSRGSTKWVLFLEGGGECASEQACYAQVNTSLGSSKYFSSSHDFSGMYYGSDDQSTNPDFYDWNHVDIPYCSQDLHSGQTVTPSNSTYGLYFSGHFVFEAILDALDATGKLQDATEIILSGASAGGIGIWPNVDYLQERYPKARVVAAPIAGFYFYAYPYTGVNHTSDGLAHFEPYAWPHNVALWSSFMDASCVKGLSATPWACMLSNYSFPFIEVESYAVEAQTDQVVLTSHDDIPQQWVTLPPEQDYLGQWRDNMTIALSPLMDPTNTRNGAFNPACFIHTSFDPQKPLIDGKSFLQAFGDWYYQRTPPAQYKLADNCGIMCNPTCP